MTSTRLHEHEVFVDEDLARLLIDDQFPDWADLSLARVASTGTDNAIFRLGDDLLVRIPRIAWAEQQVTRESTWLPHLALHLPVEVAEPVAIGRPGHGYPHSWLVSRWVPGTDALAAGEAVDWLSLASDLATLVRALHRIDVGEAPTPGKRGRELSALDAIVRPGIEALATEIDAARAVEVWEAALASPPWPGPPVWLHGDLLPGNLVLRDGRLAGVIDWSATGVGDPACDLMAAWAMPPEARARFRDELGVDDDTWARGMGWTIEQTVAFIPYYEHTLPAAVLLARQRLAAVLAAD